MAPQFRELNYLTGGGRSKRSRAPINWLLHTEEGSSSAENLARYCDGSHNVSYHYTLRDGVLCDVVDTDYASWSVLDANAYTINFCFAGSRVSMSRGEWLGRVGDIEIAAYVAVQDCRRYGIPTVVLAPPYRRASGISDHKYVTQALGIGTHVDVGNNFPWDIFTDFVNQYANNQGDDDLTPEQATMLREVHDKLLAYPDVPQIAGKWRSRAWCRGSDGGVDDTVGIELYTNAHAYDLIIAWSAVELRDSNSVNIIKRLASGEGPERSPAAIEWARRILDKIAM